MPALGIRQRDLWAVLMKHRIEQLESADKDRSEEILLLRRRVLILQAWTLGLSIGLAVKFWFFS